MDPARSIFDCMIMKTKHVKHLRNNDVTVLAQKRDMWISSVFTQQTNNDAIYVNEWKRIEKLA